ncbi:glutamate receptor ionotropic, kainate glr-3-like [Daphnia carinata]|uniref:glutamate receptor ionotropic, kainate glr-3-like n=1 Tax=Daphnia carinata TaxID=120202 RepID=UPI002579595E|nr:glutamate receptor ionotropic, kainate glr-3-like [Daphnia carinata]
MDVHRSKIPRQSLYQLHLLISSTRNPLINDPELAVINFGIIEKIVLDILASQIGFTYEIIRPRDILTSGFLQSNGSWTGTTGQLQRKEVDMCVTMSAPASSKAKVVDISYPVVYADSAILVPFPKENSRTWFGTSSFQLPVWIVILVTLVATTVVSWIIIRVHSSRLGVTAPTLGYWVVYYFGLWTSQSITPRGSTTPFRILCLATIFGIYITMNYFTASYTSILSTPVFKPAINSIEDSAKSTTVKTLLIKGSSTDEHIMASSNPTLKRLADQMRRHPERRIVNALMVDDIAEIVKDNTALVMVESNAESLIESSYKINRKCLVTLAEKTFFGRPQVFTYPKNSPIAKAIDYELLLMHQAGLIQYAERTAKSQNPCRVSDVTTDQAKKIAPLGRKEMSGSLVIVALGMAISFFVFLIELIIAKIQKAFARK